LIQSSNEFKIHLKILLKNSKKKRGFFVFFLFLPRFWPAGLSFPLAQLPSPPCAPHRPSTTPAQLGQATAGPAPHACSPRPAADARAPPVGAVLVLPLAPRSVLRVKRQPPPRPHFGRGSVSPRAPAATNGSPYPPPFPLLLPSPFLLALAAETASQRLVGFAVRPPVSHDVLVPSLPPVSPVVSSPCPSLSPRASLASVRGF